MKTLSAHKGLMNTLKDRIRLSYNPETDAFAIDELRDPLGDGYEVLGFINDSHAEEFINEMHDSQTSGLSAVRLAYKQFENRKNTWNDQPKRNTRED